MRKINSPSVRKDYISSANVLQNQQDKYISGFKNTGYTFYLPQSVMPHVLKMLIFVVLQNVVLNSMNIGSQSKCYKFAYMSSTSQQCGKKDVAGTEVLTSSRTTYVCVFVHMTSRAFLQSSFAFLCFPSWLFSWVLLWVLNNTVLHSTLDTQPGFFFFLLFSRPLALYSQWKVCVTLHISCP